MKYSVPRVPKSKVISCYDNDFPREEDESINSLEFTINFLL